VLRLLTYRRWIVRVLSRYRAFCRYHKSAGNRGPIMSRMASIFCPLISRKSVNGAWNIRKLATSSFGSCPIGRGIQLRAWRRRIKGGGPPFSRSAISGVAKALNITFAAAERDMRRHALFLDNQMKQASGSPESYGLAQSPVWTWLKDQRG
ncbi:hypothetical protein BC938DRAFT_478454, partial [Jimgerdemannia flammicorona]